MLINPGVILTNVSFINIGHENVTNTKKEQRSKSSNKRGKESEPPTTIQNKLNLTDIISKMCPSNCK